MAMPKRFTHYLGLRLSGHTKKHLDKRAEIMEVRPAVAARMLIEHSVDGIKYEHPKTFWCGTCNKETDHVTELHSSNAITESER